MLQCYFIQDLMIFCCYFQLKLGLRVLKQICFSSDFNHVNYSNVAMLPAVLQRLTYNYALLELF